MIAITNSVNKPFRRRGRNIDTICISLIDFYSLENTKVLERPEKLREIRKAILPYVETDYIEAHAYQVYDFLEENGKDITLNNILENIYIMKDSNDDIRLIKDSKIPIHRLIPYRVMKIMVYDSKEALRKEKDVNNIDPYIYYKKIWGSSIYIHDANDKKSFLGILESAIDVNTSDILDTEMAFLIEYHDCKISTVLYIEKLLSNIMQYHASVMLLPQGKIDQITHADGIACFMELKDEYMVSTVL